MSNCNKLTVLSATGRILRKLQLYNLINGDQSYEASQIAIELKIDVSIVPEAVNILQKSALIVQEGDKIRLTDIAIDSSAIRPEELMYRPRFHSIIHAVMTCLDPDKGGVIFDKSVFIIMAYDDRTNSLRNDIRTACKKFGLTARFADERAYADQIWDNVICYALSSKYGIALFHKNSDSTTERPIHSYNLNVALEIGAMLAWGRPCCLLKDKSLFRLQTDLVGWIYKECDFEDLTSVIAKIEGFFEEKGLKRTEPS